MPATTTSPAFASSAPSGHAAAAAAALPSRLHALVALALAAAAFLASWHLSGRINAELFQSYATDVWFQADLQRVLQNMTDADSSHYRNKVHPIASLVVYPFTHLLQAIHPMPDLVAARVASALWAGAWVAVLYALLVALGLASVAAVAFVLLALASASFVMFFSVPELYHLGSLSMMAVLLGAAIAVRRGIGERAVLALGLGSLAITTTNWMAGLALAVSHLPWRRAVRVSALVLAITMVLAVVQKLVFPTSGLFFLAPSGETLYVGREEAGTVWHRLSGMLLHPLVLPDLGRLPPAKDFLWPLLTVQQSAPGGSRGTGAPALAIWIALLAAGLAGARALGAPHRRFLFVLFGTLAGQVGLHLVYGEETFLYGLHFLPFLLTLAALSWFTRARPLVVPAALVLAALALANNLAGFTEAVARLEGALTERERLQRAVAARPDGAWPRNEGHVVLGEPGTPLGRKGFHEPGGGFSPAPGSFGVSVWITDAAGVRLATSDTLALSQVRQSLVAEAGRAVPALVTDTPGYQVSWSWRDDHFEMDLRPARADAGQRTWVLLRSAGPSGAPVRSIRREGARLLLNERWAVDTPAAALAVLGDEAPAGIDLRAAAAPAARQPVAGPPPRDERTAAGGWLYAAVPVEGDGLLLRVTDLGAPRGEALPASAAYWTPAVPDARFAAMAHAQQAHLLMGLTDLGTRPGEPVSYDFDWLRDGAYVIAALARAGQVATVERLAPSVAERDHFGGFGAEADAPGLGIWAIAEAARAVGSARFDSWAWPHVRRKAGLVTACLAATTTIVARPAGPVLQAYRDDPLTRRPCEPAIGGLAMGHMDHHYPVLFVNAVNYLGLREAAGLARRVGEDGEAAALEARAEALAQAWRAKFLQSPRDAATGLLPRAPQLAGEFLRQQVGFKRRLTDWIRAADNDRTYVSALWPSGVLGKAPALASAFEARLGERWRQQRDGDGAYRQAPKWTYFSFAEAHQWLALGRPERAWQTLDYFMGASASPGLYTWWEEGAEENASHRWTSMRGWTDARRITPHYWSAAEALMLQMAMLVHVDRADPEAPVVIGAGVPAAWLGQRIDSGTIRTQHGPVRWVWDAGRLVVDVADAAVPLRAAPVFGGAEMVVRSEASSGLVVAQVVSGGTGAPTDARAGPAGQGR
ncbi:MAG TPA: hypothetical protein VFE82_08005 [Ramlibacter sp.]|jgi:hypothetical protein|uniref:hypothetical protein n=1 Tax=Ramlibacter sp. TaxID=1917967 RepID=UPI002D5EE6F4|nr:hypothetical protein [Ramlibacter sp.]HZY18410.1 hypothetical protein [Ramlibacter sp.]